MIGDRVSRRSADAFRAANVQFIDASGNAFIAFGGVFVDVRGRTEQAGRIPAELPRGQARSAANLFSRERSQVILALLAWPELAEWSRRDIAATAGTSLGQTHDVLTQLEAAGFLRGRRRRVLPRDILDHSERTRTERRRALDRMAADAETMACTRSLSTPGRRGDSRSWWRSPRSP